MKRIFFGPKGNVDWHEFIWNPWGFFKYLLRWLLFIALLAALVWLISLFHEWQRRRDPILFPPHRDSLIMPDTTTRIVRNIPNPGRNLPAPPENVLPPIDDDDIVDDENGRRIVGNKLGVILDANPQEDTYRKWADAFKAAYPEEDYKVVYYNQFTNLLRIQVPADERTRVLNELPGKIPDISFKVFPDAILEVAAVPSDPAFGANERYDWYLEPIQAYKAWDVTMGKEDVVVAIVDSSFDLYHDELNSDRIVLPYSVTRESGNVAPSSPRDVHGTMVASMAIGGVNNDRGLSGIAPNCKFMPISLGQEPFTTFSIISGALYAIYQGADVVNLSLGYSLGILAAMSVEQQISLSEQLNLVEEDVWDYVFSLANDRNVMIVWAAGNDNVFVGLDATKRNATTLRVSAVDESLHKAGFSNFGNIAQLNIKETSVSAPGVKIFGACPNNSFAAEQGTSFAAPLVTGAVALMKSLNPDLTNTQIIQIIQQTSRPIAGNESIGDLLQIYDALNKVQEMGIRPLQN